jgi:hypothetical protein
MLILFFLSSFAFPGADWSFMASSVAASCSAIMYSRGLRINLLAATENNQDQRLQIRRQGARFHAPVGHVSVEVPEVAEVNDESELAIRDRLVQPIDVLAIVSLSKCPKPTVNPRTIREHSFLHDPSTKTDPTKAQQHNKQHSTHTSPLPRLVTFSFPRNPSPNAYISLEELEEGALAFLDGCARD